MSDDPQWLAWRLAGITASDVAMAATGKYGSAYSVVASKLGLLPPTEQTAPMARGLAWEQRIADMARISTGLYVVGEQTWCQHRDHDHHRATVDGFLSPFAAASFDDVEALLEIKTRAREAALDYWNVQVQWQLWCTGLDRAVIADVTIDDTDDTFVGMRLHRIDADPFEQERLVDLAEALWSHVQAGTLPELDNASALDAVKAVHATTIADADTLDLTDVQHDLERYKQITAAVRQVEDERDMLEARIRDAIGGATVATTADGWRVKCGDPALVLTREAEADIVALRPELEQRGRLDPAAKKTAKEFVDSYRQRIGARRLTITPPKGHES